MITFKQFLELAESSMPERGRRRVSPRGITGNPRKRKEIRTRTSDKAALKKAGFRTSPTNQEPGEHVHSSSPFHRTTVGTYKNQADYTLDNTPKKTSPYGGSKVTPTSTRVRQARAIRNQMGGDRTSRLVHDVSIVPSGSHVKNDSKDLIKRGKSFKQETKKVPDTLKKTGAKPTDKVTAEPAAYMRGEDQKKGKQKRAEIYNKEFGAKMSSKTGRTIMSVGNLR